MKYLKKLFKRKSNTTYPEMVICIDFHDGTIREQRVGMIDCVKEEDNLIRICCVSN